MKHLFLFLVLVSYAFADAPVQPMQTTQDKADGNRLVINGNKVFISGMNIAWNSFANDVGDNAVNLAPFEAQFKQIRDAGGNAVRWWLHTDNQRCPKLDANGKVTGIGSQTIKNIQRVLDLAYSYGIVVSLTLFSFDLLQGDNKSADLLAKNEKFLTVESNLDSYITNGLKPILAAVGNHPAIMCWEVFNEPEGMSSDAGGWSTKKIEMKHILRFTAKIAAEVHRSTKKMASSGIHEFGKMKTWYSDAKLKTASGNNDALAYLDFYMAHYYPEYIGTSGSPFHNKASFWGMDRPVLIGEFPAQSWGPGTGYNNIQQGTAMTITAAYEYAYDNGYCGLMSWSMTEGDKAKFGSFSTTEPALKNLSSKHKADIEITNSNKPASSTSGVSSSSVASSSSITSSSSAAVASSSSRASSSSATSISSSSANGSSITLSCTGLQETVEKGGVIAQPTLTCSNGSQATNVSWTGRPGQNTTWTQNAASTTTAYTIGANATCGSASGLTTVCGTVMVIGVTIPTPSSSSTAVSSSSSESSADISSSSEGSTPIVSHSPLAANHSSTYYSLKGEPLGSVKPQKAGVYIVKQGYSVKKIVVR